MLQKISFCGCAARCAERLCLSVKLSKKWRGSASIVRKSEAQPQELQATTEKAQPFRTSTGEALKFA